MQEERTEVVRALLRDLPRHKSAPPGLERLPAAATVLRYQTSQKTYVATHSTQPPPDQVITTETQNILVREFLSKQKAKARQPSGSSPTRGKKRKAAS